MNGRNDQPDRAENPPGTEQDTHAPEVLGYQAARDRAQRSLRPNRELRITLLIFGAIAACIATLFVVAILAMWLEPPGGPRMLSVICIFGFVAAGLAAIGYFRKGHLDSAWRWWMLGSVIGCGVALLIDGICFGKG